MLVHALWTFVILYWMDPAHGPSVAFIVNLPLCACPILSKRKQIFVDFSHSRFFAAPFVLHWYRCSPHSRSVCLIWMASNKTNTRLVFNRWVSHSIRTYLYKIRRFEMCVRSLDDMLSVLSMGRKLDSNINTSASSGRLNQFNNYKNLHIY